MILIFTLINFLVGNSVESHDLTELDKLCLQAKDYGGCIDNNVGTINTDLPAFNDPPDWRYYGPIKVQWNNWYRKGSNLVTSSLNKQNKLFYLAVNCKKSMINVSPIKIKWKGWNSPSQKFEFKLLDDICSNLSIAKDY